MTSMNRLAGASLVAMLYAAATPAQAPDPAPGGAASALLSPTAPDGGAGDIIVTAQRRDERLADVPLSVTAVTNEALERNRINDLSRVDLEGEANRRAGEIHEVKLAALLREEDINLNAHKPAEFEAWKWVDAESLPDLIVPFKKRVYRAVLEEFRALI